MSHGWLSEAHPDPKGTQLIELVVELDRLRVGDDHPVFYDFCSLPQIDKTHPDVQKIGLAALPHGHEARRTAEEDHLFSIALREMHLLYTMGFGSVLVLPNVPGSADHCVQYIDRGWCFFELAVSWPTPSPRP